MLQTCNGWDNETKALKEAFDRGIDYQKRKLMEEKTNERKS